MDDLDVENKLITVDGLTVTPPLSTDSDQTHSDPLCPEEAVTSPDPVSVPPPPPPPRIMPNLAKEYLDRLKTRQEEAERDSDLDDFKPAKKRKVEEAAVAEDEVSDRSLAVPHPLHMHVICV